MAPNNTRSVGDQYALLISLNTGRKARKSKRSVCLAEKFKHRETSKKEQNKSKETLLETVKNLKMK